MLYIRPVGTEDLERINALLKEAFPVEEERATYDFIQSNTMIFLDGDSAVGFCSFKVPMADQLSEQLKAAAFIDVLYLTEQARNFNFTDGLLRAMLNYMLKHGVESAYVPSSATDEVVISASPTMLKRIGMEPVAESEGETAVIKAFRAYNYGGAQSLYKVNLCEFFDRPCRSEQSGHAYS